MHRFLLLLALGSGLALTDSARAAFQTTSGTLSASGAETVTLSPGKPSGGDSVITASDGGMQTTNDFGCAGGVVTNSSPSDTVVLSFGTELAWGPSYPGRLVGTGSGDIKFTLTSSAMVALQTTSWQFTSSTGNSTPSPGTAELLDGNGMQIYSFMSSSSSVIENLTAGSYELQASVPYAYSNPAGQYGFYNV